LTCIYCKKLLSLIYPNYCANCNVSYQYNYKTGVIGDTLVGFALSIPEYEVYYAEMFNRFQIYHKLIRIVDVEAPKDLSPKTAKHYFDKFMKLQAFV
jgi:hypothetical protein